MLFNTKACTGCKTCEIACSYHHRQIFCTSISSIKIIKGEEESGFSVLLYEESNDSHLRCDGCEREEMPLCIKYCPVIARHELTSIMQEFQNKLTV